MKSAKDLVAMLATTQKEMDAEEFEKGMIVFAFYRELSEPFFLANEVKITKIAERIAELMFTTDEAAFTAYDYVDAIIYTSARPFGKTLDYYLALNECDFPDVLYQLARQKRDIYEDDFLKGEEYDD